MATRLAAKNKGVTCVSKKKHPKRLHFSQNRPISILNAQTKTLGCIAPSAVSARSISKVEGKDSQLPVTDLVPEVQLPGQLKHFVPSISNLN
jgi:hypothetical protein